MVEIKLPFIEYVDDFNKKAIRFVQAVGDNSWAICAVHVKGSSGWQILEY